MLLARLRVDFGDADIVPLYRRDHLSGSLVFCSRDSAIRPVYQRIFLERTRTSCRAADPFCSFAHRR